MKGIASACGSATIINAISMGKGSAFAIDLRVRAEVKLVEGGGEITGKVGETSEDPLLIETCVGKVLKFFDVGDDYGARIRTNTELPIAAGLSSSSAAANASVLATVSALDRDLSSEEMVELGIDAAFEAGTTVTGAFDDASASFYGGGVITDNENNELLESFSINPELFVLIFLPSRKSYTTEEDFRRTKLVSELVDLAFDEAISGNLFGAQTLNGLIYSSVFGQDSQPALEALDAGALCAGLSGTGSSIVAVCEDEFVEKVKERWRECEAEIIVTKPSEEGAKIENA